MGRGGVWFVALAIAVLSTAACGRRDQRDGTSALPRSRPAHAALGAAVDLASDSVLTTLRPQLDAWIRRWSQVIPAFTLDSLYRLPPEPFRPAYSRRLTSGDLQRARRFGAVSPDSTRIAEADSYRAIIDGVPELWPEPDSAPALADLTADSLRILVTVGTTGGFEEAFWIDASRFVVTGYGEREFEPWSGGGELWVYDLARGTVAHYSTPDVNKAAYERYVESARADLMARFAAPAL